MLNMPKAKACVKLQRGRLQWKTDITDWVQGRGQQMSLCFAEWYQCWYECSSTEGVATPGRHADQSGASNPAVTDMTSGFNTEQLSQVGRYEWLWYLFFVLLPFCNVCIAHVSVLHTFFLLMNVKTNSTVTSTGDGLVPPLYGAVKPVRQYKPGELQSLKAEAPYPMPPASK